MRNTQNDKAARKQNLSRLCLLLEKTRLRFKTDRLPELGAVVHSAVCDDRARVADVADVFERIAVNQNQIGEFARFNACPNPYRFS